MCRHDLRNVNTERVYNTFLLGRSELQPTGHVTAFHVLELLLIDIVCESLAREACLTDVAAPGNRIAVHDSIVDDLLKIIDRHVPCQRIAPIVLHLYGKLCPERMMGERGEAHIVVPVKTKGSGESLRRVGLALVGELLRALAKISVENALQSYLPLAGDLLQAALGNALHVGSHHREELTEVVERVAIETAGERHGFFRTDAVMLEAIKRIVGTAALRELAVAMQAHDLDSAVHICLVGHKALAKIIGLACGLENL